MTEREAQMEMKSLLGVIASLNHIIEAADSEKPVWLGAQHPTQGNFWVAYRDKDPGLRTLLAAARQLHQDSINQLDELEAQFGVLPP